MTTARMTTIATIANVSATTVQEYVEADWDNQADHRVWLETASDEEIAAWVKDLVRANA